MRRAANSTPGTEARVFVDFVGAWAASMSTHGANCDSAAAAAAADTLVSLTGLLGGWAASSAGLLTVSVAMSTGLLVAGRHREGACVEGNGYSLVRVLACLLCACG